jgi:hypothetical protein
MAALSLILEFGTTYQKAKAIKEIMMDDIFGLNTDSCGRKKGNPQSPKVTYQMKPMRCLRTYFLLQQKKKYCYWF